MRPEETNKKNETRTLTTHMKYSNSQSIHFFRVSEKRLTNKKKGEFFNDESGKMCQANTNTVLSMPSIANTELRKTDDGMFFMHNGSIAFYNEFDEQN